MPHTQRYGLNDYNHPAFDAATILNTGSASAILNWVNSAKGVNQLSRWSVRYVILPFDSQGEIFLDDRKYSEKVRSLYFSSLEKNLYLKKVSLNGVDERISIYEVPNVKDHLWLEGANPGTKLTWQMQFPTDYTVNISGLNTPASLIFSESYDPYWQAVIGGKVIGSKPTTDKLNSFLVPANFKGKINIEYAPQRYLEYGLVVSILAFIGVISLLFMIK